MVEVAVGDQNRGARAPSRQLEPQLGSVAAGIDHDCFGCGAIGAQDVAVRLDRPEGVTVDDEAHAGECNGVHV